MKITPQLINGILELINRLVSRGDFKSPKLFQVIQLLALVVIGIGFVQELDSPIIGGVVALIIGRLPKVGSSGPTGEEWIPEKKEEEESEGGS